MSWSEPLDPSTSPQPPPPPPPSPAGYTSGTASFFEELDEDGGSMPWWLAVLLGVAMVGLGVWMLANLVESVVVLAVIIGLSLITGGIVNVFVLGGGGARWASWVEGLLLVGAGLVVLAWPDITLWSLALAGGITLVLGGLIHLAMALMNRKRRPGWTVDAGLGVLGVVLGVIVLAWPEATLVVLAILFGIRAIGFGLLAIGAGWHLRHADDELAPAA
jgi:uncharacterized membrane protein HdeD (DUF308 family)